MQHFSVVVTTLDFAPFVGRALDSVRACIDVLKRHAGAPGVEVLVVDDGSTDGTPDLVARLIEGRPGWRLLCRARPSSPSAARNFGVGQARGDVLCFLDGDDAYLPGHLEACWLALRQE